MDRLFLKGSLFFLLLVSPPAALGESFSQFLDSAYKKYPQFKAFKEELKSLDELAKDLSLLPNPEIGASVEDIFGTGQFRGLKSSETTVEISQELPLPKKVKKKREAIYSLRGVIEGKERLTRVNLFGEVADLYIQALYYREKAELYSQFTQLLDKVVYVAQAKFEAGKAPETEKLLAEVEREKWRVKELQVKKEATAALEALQALTGLRGSPEGKLTLLKPLPELSVEGSPKLLIAEAQKRSLKSKMEAVKAEVLPDIKVSAGVRHFNEVDEKAFTFGLALQVPLFNKNQYKVAALKRQVRAQELSKEATLLNLKKDFNLTLGRLEAVKERIETIEGELLPRLNELYGRMFEAYKLGRATIVELLNSQKKLLELKLELLDAYRDYHTLRAKLYQTAGRVDREFF